MAPTKIRLRRSQQVVMPPKWASRVSKENREIQGKRCVISLERETPGRRIILVCRQVTIATASHLVTPAAALLRPSYSKDYVFTETDERSFLATQFGGGESGSEPRAKGQRLFVVRTHLFWRRVQLGEMLNSTPGNEWLLAEMGEDTLLLAR